MIVFLHILGNNIIPIFILILLGFLLNKKFNLDINTLSKLNFYIFVPGFLFVNLYSASIPSGMYKVIIFALIYLISNAVIGLLVSKSSKMQKKMRSVFQNSIMFFNSGNYGFPLISLIFSSPPFVVNGETPYLNMAITTQIVIMVIQDLVTNTLGLINASSDNVHWWES